MNRLEITTYNPNKISITESVNRLVIQYNNPNTIDRSVRSDNITIKQGTTDMVSVATKTNTIQLTIRQEKDKTNIQSNDVSRPASLGPQ